MKFYNFLYLKKLRKILSGHSSTQWNFVNFVPFISSKIIDKYVVSFF